MKKDNHLVDELLKEHARKGSGADDQFLKELEQQLNGVREDGDTQVAPPSNKRWVLGASVAACLTLGTVAVYFWQQQSADDIIAYHEVMVPADQSSVSQDKVAVPDESPVAKKTNARRRGVTEELEDISSHSQFAKKSPADAQVPAPATAPSAEGVNLRGVVTTPGQSANLGLSLDGGITGAGEKGAKMKDQNLGGAGAIARGVVSICPPPRPMPPIIHPPCPMPPIMPAPQTVNPVAGEKYGALVENKFIAPTDEKSALSTFAVDVDTASYANVRRMINTRQEIPKDAVRIEEMINYFDYTYPQPKAAHPFSVQVDAMPCPWQPKHRLVRIGLQGKDIVRSERAAANLVFLLDVSGSMNSEDKLPLLKSSMGYLLEELNEKDTVSIVVYAGSSGLALPPTKVDEAGRQKIQLAMNQLSAGGSTAGGEGIKLAYDVAKQQFIKEGVNRIILATDGDFNVGVSDAASLTEMVKMKAKEGTYISVLGFGQGNTNDEMMESITNNGNGNYHYIDSIKEGRKVLLEDMMGTLVTIAKDVKIQVVMNPSQVKAYRLIGYSNRMLPAEAFLDKKVDAGEIGAGHRVTALYEIIPADGTPFGPRIDASRYFEKTEAEPKPVIKNSKETLFVKLAYKLPSQTADDESTYLSMPFIDQETEASSDLKFASAVGLFGMVLRDSEHKGNGTLEMVEKLALEGLGTDGKGQRDEFRKLVQALRTKE